jgi:hypothetical protein
VQIWESFRFFSFVSPLLLSLWANLGMMEGVFIFSTGNMVMKNTKLTQKKKFMPIHGGLTFRV